MTHEIMFRHYQRTVSAWESSRLPQKSCLTKDELEADVYCPITATCGKNSKRDEFSWITHINLVFSPQL